MLSPDGKSCAFVTANGVILHDIATGEETTLSSEWYISLQWVPESLTLGVGSS